MDHGVPVIAEEVSVGDMEEKVSEERDLDHRQQTLDPILVQDPISVQVLETDLISKLVMYLVFCKFLHLFETTRWIKIQV